MCLIGSSSSNTHPLTPNRHPPNRKSKPSLCSPCARNRPYYTSPPSPCRPLISTAGMSLSPSKRTRKVSSRDGRKMTAPLSLTILASLSPPESKRQAIRKCPFRAHCCDLQSPSHTPFSVAKFQTRVQFQPFPSATFATTLIPLSSTKRTSSDAPAQVRSASYELFFLLFLAHCRYRA